MFRRQDRWLSERSRIAIRSFVSLTGREDKDLRSANESGIPLRQGVAVVPTCVHRYPKPKISWRRAVVGVQ